MTKNKTENDCSIDTAQDRFTESEQSQFDKTIQEPHARPFQFSDEQLSELREQAVFLVEQENRERLSWDEAWSGVYPEKPSDEQVKTEFDVLKAKAERILTAGSVIDQEYSNWDEHRRMIALEACQTFNIWN